MIKRKQKSRKSKGFRPVQRKHGLVEKIKPELERRLLPILTSRLVVDLNLVLFDTTSVSFEDRARCELATFGYSRDRRSDLRQVILGLLVSREGVPLGHLVLPGRTVDLVSLQHAQTQLLGHLPIGRMILVADRGMVSAANLQRLEEAGVQYIVGVRLREHETRAVIKRAGRFQYVAPNLWVKEVCVGGRRYVVCYNPEEATKDRQEREHILQTLEIQLANGGLRRLLRSTAARRYLRIQGSEVAPDMSRIREEARYDGKWVLLTNTNLPAPEVALAYKGLWQVEKAFRTLKNPLKVRPIFRWTERRVRAHISVCVLAYLLEPVLELRLRARGLEISSAEAMEELKTITVSEVTVAGVRCRLINPPVEEQKKIFAALDLTFPPLVERLEDRRGN